MSQPASIGRVWFFLLTLSACLPELHPGEHADAAVCDATAPSPDAGQDEEDASAPPPAQCRVDDDCWLFADYCQGCHCLALGADQAAPSCGASHEVECVADPCRGASAHCVAGRCTASPAPPQTR